MKTPKNTQIFSLYNCFIILIVSQVGVGSNPVAPIKKHPI